MAKIQVVQHKNIKVCHTKHEICKEKNTFKANIHKMHTGSNNHVSESFLRKRFDVLNYECSEIRLAFRVICGLLPDLLPKNSIHSIFQHQIVYKRSSHSASALEMFAGELGNQIYQTNTISDSAKSGPIS